MRLLISKRGTTVPAAGCVAAIWLAPAELSKRHGTHMPNAMMASLTYPGSKLQVPTHYPVAGGSAAPACAQLAIAAAGDCAG